MVGHQGTGHWWGRHMCSSNHTYPAQSMWVLYTIVSLHHILNPSLPWNLFQDRGRALRCRHTPALLDNPLCHHYTSHFDFDCTVDIEIRRGMIPLYHRLPYVLFDSPDVGTWTTRECGTDAPHAAMDAPDAALSRGYRVDAPDAALDAVLLHCLNHCTKVADRIKKGNEAVRSGLQGTEAPRDQGFTRPKVHKGPKLIQFLPVTACAVGDVR